MSEDFELDRTILLQVAKGDAYRDGQYELDDWEGYTCTSCGWRGISAPMADEEDRSIEDNIITKCPECDEPGPETPEVDTEWDKVEEKIPDEYLEKAGLKSGDE